MSARLGIDVGGTFTDLLLLDESSGEIRLLKTPSTPEDQSIGIIDGTTALLDRANVRPGDIRTVLHGTTVSTNIVLEEKGARVGLLVTENFEQVLHLARSQTPGPLAGWMIMKKPDPLADLEHTRGVAERIDARGRILRPLDETKARKAIRDLLDAGVESITVSLMHSYANDTHEQRLKALVEETGADVPVSLSCEILPEFREYERTLVTVMNAYVRPSMRRYLQSLDDKLRAVDLNATVHIVRSDGGLMSIARASDSPAHTMLSGPAGGVSGAAFVAGLAGHRNALGFDMGGTSTDVSLVRDGVPTISRQTSLGYYPIKVPSVEVHSVGAGGGSIAHVPMTGALRVGPQSAGAVPGPACYGKGGVEPTVTDANVVLGRLPPSLLGGEMALDADASSAAVGKIARALNLDVYQAARGILDIVNENMFGALRLVTVQKGPRPARLRPGRVRRRGPPARQRARHARRVLSGHRATDPGGALRARIPVLGRQERVRAHLHPHHRRGRRSRRARGAGRRSASRRERGFARRACPRPRRRCASRPTCATSGRGTSSRST